MRFCAIIVFFILAIGASVPSVAQDNEANKESEKEGKANSVLSNPLFRLNQQVYIRARKYNDTEVAKDALYRMVTMDPANDSLLFQLGYLYYEQGKFFSSVFVMNDVLSLNPDYEAALEISGSSYQRIGALEKSAQAYETLYLKTQDINVLYRLAFVQYDLKRDSEAEANANIILKSPKSKEIKLLFEGDNKKNVEVSMSAVVLNLKGLIQLRAGNKGKAKEFFEESLKEAPEFSLPKKELDKLK
ncbi:hypothetical protein FUAX_21550 [Fulvitalea axinellae]|uniref:Tetratricopeptide repeat protein n=1 Tax=Fulvitalea axinellae TaxID=1182444 RepID=A0AAU9CNU8_9BACT|nr:hypothetical protein FUAX_21550 [Fulvitalea axinellae]